MSIFSELIRQYMVDKLLWLIDRYSSWCKYMDDLRQIHFLRLLHFFELCVVLLRLLLVHPLLNILSHNMYTSIYNQCLPFFLTNFNICSAMFSRKFWLLIISPAVVRRWWAYLSLSSENNFIRPAFYSLSFCPNGQITIFFWAIVAAIHWIAIFSVKSPLYTPQPQPPVIILASTYKLLNPAYAL